MKISKKAILYSAAVLALSNIGLQLLGFVYRILISRLAGAQGMGVYQLVLSIYPVIMSVTASGLVLAVSRLSAQRHALRDGAGLSALMRVAVKGFLLLFSAMAGAYIAFSRHIAGVFLGDERTRTALLLLLPCLLLTGMENLFKSYFMGVREVRRPVVSELLEQTVRICAVAGLLAAFRPEEPAVAAALIVAGMIVSEVFSVSFLSISYARHKKRQREMTGTKRISTGDLVRSVAAAAIPVSLSGLLNNLLGSADTLLMPKRLVDAGMAQGDATALLGTLFGMIMPLFWLPAAFIGALSSVMLPRLSEGIALRDTAGMRRYAAKSIHATGLLALPVVAVLVPLGPSVCRLLYKQTVPEEYLIALAVGSVFMYYQLISGSLLNGAGMQKRASIYVVIGGIIQLVFTYMGGDPRIGVWGFLTGNIVSTVVTAWLNMRCVRRKIGLRMRWGHWFVMPAVTAAGVGVAAWGIFTRVSAAGVQELPAVLVTLALCILLYDILLMIQGLSIPRYIKTLIPSGRME